MTKPKIVVLVGPPGSGKSTYAAGLEAEGFVRISQDDQGKEGHHNLFVDNLSCGKNLVVDRMNFSIEQRNKYLIPAKLMGYETQIVVFHVPKDECFKRCVEREGHPTIQSGNEASSALNTFFTKYQRVEEHEADIVTRLGWDKVKKEDVIVCDLDGTLCNIDHRLHFVKGDKKDWKGFFNGIPKDTPNEWCVEIITTYSASYYAFGGGASVVYCSGRPDDTRETTLEWLSSNSLYYDNSNLFMRPRNDFRRDDIVKEIILDFEILTRYNVLFCIDDRQQVVDMWRRRGLTCLQCAKGDF